MNHDHQKSNGGTTVTNAGFCHTGDLAMFLNPAAYFGNQLSSFEFCTCNLALEHTFTHV